jgi:hypothetical protein
MTHVSRWLVMTMALVGGAVGACSAGDAAVPGPKEAPPGPEAAVASGPTFHKDVAPILEARCQKCHTPGGLAPFALTTYADAKAMSPAIVAETSARRMPPWGAQDTDECKPRLPWNHDERLSDAELSLLKDWDAAGSPEGDPKDAPAPRLVAALDLPNATDTLAPRTAFAASGDRDQFRCFVLDHPYESGAYITGIHVVPGNKKVVHHAVVFTDPGGRFSAPRVGPDGSFDCSSAAMANDPGDLGLGDGTRQQQSTTLDVWAPGNTPIDLPSNVAIALAPRSKLVMQIHYSPGGQAAEPDITKVQLRASFQKPDFLLFTTSLGNFPSQLPNGDGLIPGAGDVAGQPGFEIPRNARDHVEKMQITMPALESGGSPIWIYGLMAHQHLAGIDVKVDLERAGAAQCLLQDRWDFHWQRMYTYDAPTEKLPTLQEGDIIKLRCTYDNSMFNPRLGLELRKRNLTPMDLHLGEQTLDEMCLVIPQLLIRHP